MDPKIYVINLLRSIDRRRSIQGQLNDLGINYELIEAIDGMNLSSYWKNLYSEKWAIYYQNIKMSCGEIGCAASHLMVYKMMIERGESSAIILEDDARLGIAFKRFLNSFGRIMLDPWELLNLVSTTPSLPTGKECFDIYEYSQFVENPSLTTAYCLRLSAAEKLYGFAFPIRFPSDGLIGRCHEIGVNIKSILPEIVSRNDGFPSEIGVRAMHVSDLSRATKYPRR